MRRRLLGRGIELQLLPESVDNGIPSDTGLIDGKERENQGGWAMDDGGRWTT